MATAAVRKQLNSGDIEIADVSDQYRLIYDRVVTKPVLWISLTCNTGIETKLWSKFATKTALITSIHEEILAQMTHLIELTKTLLPYVMISSSCIFN